MTCLQPTSKEEYEKRYLDNHQISGHGIEGVTNHFPCPFCAHPDWHVVTVLDFAIPEEPGNYSTEPIRCECCERSARYISVRYPDHSITMSIEQADGPPAPEWVPFPVRRDVDES